MRGKSSRARAVTRIERLEDRSMLSATPISYSADGLDALTYNGPKELPAFSALGAEVPFAIDGKIDLSLWNAATAIETAVAAGSLSMVEDSTAELGFDLTNLSTAEVLGSGDVRVYAEVDSFGASTLGAIEALGLQTISISEAVGVIELWAPYNRLEDLAALSAVSFVRTPIQPISNAGLVDSAGDVISSADSVRAAFGFDGSGIKVGVISDGVDNAALVQGAADPDLPAFTVNDARPGFGDEGTAMLEIVHDLAPGADLFFSSGIDGVVGMIDSINWLVGQGVDVIVDDLGFFGQHYFSDDVIAQTVDAAVAAGVTYLTSAGNQAQLHYQGQADFATGFHNFSTSGGTDQLLDIGTVPVGGVVDVFLQWSDPLGGSGNDYDLGLFNLDDATFVGFTANPQTGSQDPLESFRWTNNTGAAVNAAVVVDDSGSPLSRELELFVLPRNYGLPNLPDDDRTLEDSIFGHAASLSAIAVGAIDASDVGNDDIQAFSNRGTSTIYTDFTTQTSVDRDALDGASIDGVQTRIGQLGFFGNPFFGTSAAAPHAAAIAALMLDADPTLTPADVSSVLASTAVDLLAPGYDSTSGAGRFDALAAVFNVFTPGAPDLAASSDTGNSSTDNLTNDNTPRIQGVAPADAFVRLYVDGVERGSQQLTGGDTTYDITVTTPLAAGARDITVRVGEDATTPLVNLSNESAPLTITIDTSTAIPGGLNLVSASDTGSSSTDNITADSTPRIIGNAEAGASVVLRANGQVVGTDTADGTGAWSIISQNLADGAYTITAEATDAAGNAASSIGGLSVTIDTSIATPGALNLVDADDTGVSSSDNVTSDSTPRFNGTAEAFASIRLLADGVEVGTTTATSGGTWQLASAALADGVRQITAEATDLAGNTSTSSALAVTIDTSTATPGALNLVDADDTGASSADNVTNINAARFNGTAEAFASIRLLADGVEVGTTTATSGGTWQLASSALADGAYTITAEATDAAGNTATSGGGLAVTIDTVISVPTTPNLTTASDTGVSGFDNITTDDTPAFIGTAEADSNIVLLADGLPVKTKSANSNGTYGITADPLADGVRQMTLRATDLAGNTAESNALTVTIDTVGPRVTDVVIQHYDTATSTVTGEVLMSQRVAAGEQLNNVGLVQDQSPNRLRLEFDSPVADPTSQIGLVGLLGGTQPSLSLAPGQTGLRTDWAWDVTSGTLSRFTSNYFGLSLSGVTDTAGAVLDGEWVNPEDVNAASGKTVLESGDGAAGGDFNFVFATLLADFNGDHNIDLLDLDILGGNFGQSPAIFTDGDANGDGVVDLLDLDIFGSDFGHGITTFQNLLAFADDDGDGDLDASDRDALLLALADMDGDNDHDQLDIDIIDFVFAAEFG